MLVAKPVRLPLSMLILQFPVAIQLLVGVRISEFIVPFDKKPPVPIWFEVLLVALAVGCRAAAGPGPCRAAAGPGPCRAAAGPGPCRAAAGPVALAADCSAAAGPKIFCGGMKYGIIGEK